MTDDLITWLRAQLDEDERVARAAIPGPWRWGPDPAVADGRIKLMGQGYRVVVNGVDASVFPHESTAAFIQANDPARVLAEVDAKRRILERAERYGRWAANDDAPGFQALDEAGKLMVRYVALPYADRPGYRPEWAPPNG